MTPDAASERRALALFEQALDLPEAEREAWLYQTSDDDGVRRRTIAMLAADRIESLRTGGAAAADEEADEPVPDTIGAYRITGLIAHGGMGAVYRGERIAGDFTRTVAIKRIRPGLLSAALVDRFERERQTLAKLEHPHIARLYDGGAMADDAPYLVMEYVDGEPILSFAASRGLDRTARLALFEDICSAVAYAHRNLVIHRDITPANVLVTAGGAAKLIDFGIAQPALDDDDDRLITVSGLSQAPAYAAPERVSGSVGSTAGDVYSLGKLLATLIAEPRGAELDAIVARASAIEPEARYPTVDALAADLAALRNGRAVAAMGRERGYLWRTFYRRNRTAIVAAGGALALLLAAFAGTLWSLDRANAARADAERRFEDTRSIAKAMLFNVFDDVSKVSGATGARATLAETGLRYLDGLAADPDAPRDVKLEAGQGYLRLAQVTGDGQSAQLGKFDEANALLAKAAAILEPLHRAAPADPTTTRAFAALLVEQAGTNIYNNSRPDLARKQAREAQALLAPLKAADAATVRTYALAMQVEGDSFLWTNDYARARAINEKVERYITGLPAKLASDPAVMGVRTSNLRLLGEALHKLKMAGPARAVLDRNIAVARALAATDPANPDLQRRLAVALRYAGVVHRSNYRDPEALATISESVSIARRLLERDPRDAGALKLLVVTSEVYAQVLGDAARYRESFVMGAEVYAAQQTLVRLAGNAPGALRSMAASTSTRGTNHYNGGDYAGACKWWNEALGTYLSLKHRGQLTDTDRRKGVPELQGYIKQGCNPARKMADEPA